MGELDRRLEQSAVDFDREVRPIIEEDMGGDIEIIELVTDRDVAKELDRHAGIDAWWFTDGGVRGMANRVQWMSNASTDEPYETFTIRCSTVYGTETELAKRQRAIAEDYLFPHVTVQAYLEEPNGGLLSAALCHTADLIELIEGGSGSKISPPGRNSFYVVGWDELADAGGEVTAWRA